MIIHRAGEMSKRTGHLLPINFITKQPKLAVFALKLKRLTVLQRSIWSDKNQSLMLINSLIMASVLCAQPLVEDKGT